MRDLTKHIIMNKLDEGLPLAPGEVAYLFQVTSKTAARWCEGRSPKLKSFKTLGGHRRIPADVVIAALREGM